MLNCQLRLKKMKSVTSQDNNKYTGSRDDDSSSKNYLQKLMKQLRHHYDNMFVSVKGSTFRTNQGLPRPSVFLRPGNC